MTARHHPAEATLVALAAGSLDLAAATVVATHVAACPACRKQVALGEAVGGTMLAGLPPSVLRADALACTLARLDAPAAVQRPPSPAPMPPPRMLAPGVPLPATLAGLAPGRWRWVAPGVRRISLLRQTQAHGRLYLLCIEPGVQVPAHGHEAWEATCVLSGTFRDELGAFGPGDLVEVDAAHHHRPVAGGPMPCICLVAAAGQMRFTSMLARLWQPLVGV